MARDTEDLPDPPELDLRLDDMELDTLSGDLRDAMLTRFRAQPKTWPQMNEAEQRDCASAFDLAARAMVREAVRLLTSWEWPRVVVRLGNVTIKPGEKASIEAKLSAPLWKENLETLANAAGDSVLLLVVDSEEFLGERRPASVQPDQPDLPIEEPPQTREEVERDVAAMGGGEDDGPRADMDPAVSKEALAQEAVAFETHARELFGDGDGFEASQEELAAQKGRRRARAAAE